MKSVRKYIIYTHSFLRILVFLCNSRVYEFEILFRTKRPRPRDQHQRHRHTREKLELE